MLKFVVFWEKLSGQFQEYQHHCTQGGLRVRKSVCKQARKLLRIAVFDDTQDKVVPKKEEEEEALILWSVAKDHDYVQNSSPGLYFKVKAFPVLQI